MVKNCSNCKLTLENALSSYVGPSPECAVCKIVIVGKERMPSQWKPATKNQPNKEVAEDKEEAKSILKQYADTGIPPEQLNILADRLAANNISFLRWISVEEKLPGLHEPVIICREKNGVFCVNYGVLDINDWWYVFHGTRCKKVTHWMPLPTAPHM